jgi:hypothetical protein
MMTRHEILLTADDIKELVKDKHKALVPKGLDAGNPVIEVKTATGENGESVNYLSIAWTVDRSLIKTKRKIVRRKAAENKDVKGNGAGSPEALIERPRTV